MYALNLTLAHLLLAHSTQQSPLISISTLFNQKKFDIANTKINHCFSTILFASSIAQPIRIKKSHFAHILDTAFLISSENSNFVSKKFTSDISFSDSSITYHNCLFEGCSISINTISWFYGCFFNSCGNSINNLEVILSNEMNLISCIFENNHHILKAGIVYSNNTKIYNSNITLEGRNSAIFYVPKFTINDVNFTSNQATFCIDNNDGKIIPTFNRICLSYNKFQAAFYLGVVMKFVNAIIYNNDAVLFQPSLKFGSVKVPVPIQRSCIFLKDNNKLFSGLLKFEFTDCNFNVNQKEINNGNFINCKFGVNTCDYAEDMAKFTPIPEKKYFAYNIIGDIVETFAYQ